jgi:hypothetical protein
LFFVAYVRGTQTSNPGPFDGAGVWVEEPYDPSLGPNFQFENDTTDPIWLNDVGIAFNLSTEVAIQNLNPSFNSQLTSLPCRNGVLLNPGSHVSIPLAAPQRPQSKSGS